jgi:hypothetical protein
MGFGLYGIRIFGLYGYIGQLPVMTELPKKFGLLIPKTEQLTEDRIVGFFGFGPGFFGFGLWFWSFMPRLSGRFRV